jgi:hypothetical protein
MVTMIIHQEMAEKKGKPSEKTGNVLFFRTGMINVFSAINLDTIAVHSRILTSVMLIFGG